VELPLSHAQQRLWFFHRLSGPSPLYNIPLPLRLEGALDVTAPGSGAGDIIGRHESLRTIFPEKSESPRQVILARNRCNRCCTVSS